MDNSSYKIKPNPIDEAARNSLNTVLCELEWQRKRVLVLQAVLRNFLNDYVGEERKLLSKRMDNLELEAIRAIYKQDNRTPLGDRGQCGDDLGYRAPHARAHAIRAIYKQEDKF